jgi:hypothetical protein
MSGKVFVEILKPNLACEGENGLNSPGWSVLCPSDGLQGGCAPVGLPGLTGP